MTFSRELVQWVGAALLFAGALFGIYGLVLTGYAPLSATWWAYNFNVFWGGIAALVAGVAAVFGAQYLMEEEVPPFEEEKRKMGIPA
jgi:hypothetical protein